MKAILLIGFSYEELNDLEVHPLPGILIDLYQVYTYFTNIGYDKILLITDIWKSTPISLLSRPILEGIVNSNILNFIDSTGSIQFLYTTEDAFISKIKEFIADVDELVVYYTGHSKKNLFVLPNVNYGITKIDHVTNTSFISIDKFRDIIINGTPFNSQILFILDACNGIGLKLPFQLHKSQYRLADLKSHNYIKKEVLCLSSAMHDEKSGTFVSGSLFTRSLIKSLKEKITYLPNLLSKINEECTPLHKQTATVNSTYPSMKYLWNWIMCNKTHFKFNYYSKNLLFIERKY